MTIFSKTFHEFHNIFKENKDPWGPWAGPCKQTRQNRQNPGGIAEDYMLCIKFLPKKAPHIKRKFCYPKRPHVNMR